MSMWLCRAGRYGEYENRFLEDGRIYCTWDNLDVSISSFATKQDLQQYFIDREPDVKEALIKSARADSEKICVLMKAVFRRNTLCIARKSDEIRA